MLSKCRNGGTLSSGSDFTGVADGGGVCDDADASLERDNERAMEELDAEIDGRAFVEPASCAKTRRELACSAVRNWRIWSLCLCKS
jgi:hypothetical protein